LVSQQTMKLIICNVKTNTSYITCIQRSLFPTLLFFCIYSQYTIDHTLNYTLLFCSPYDNDHSLLIHLIFQQISITINIQCVCISLHIYIYNMFCKYALTYENKYFILINKKFSLNLYTLHPFWN